MAYGQLDLKNSLYDLQSRFRRSTSAPEKSQLAVSIAGFFFTNRVNKPAMRDSALRYCDIAELYAGNKEENTERDNAVFMRARILVANGQIAEVKRMVRNSTGPLFCRLSLFFGNYFREKPGETKQDLDTADRYIQKVFKYLAKHKYPRLKVAAQFYQWQLMVERRDDQQQSDALIAQVLNSAIRFKQYGIITRILEIKAYYELAGSGSMNGYYNAVNLERKLGDKAAEAGFLKDIANRHIVEGKIDTAEKELYRVLELYKSSGYKNLQFTYDLLGAAAMVRGNLAKAMRHMLAAAKYAEYTGTDFARPMFYGKLADLCNTLGLEQPHKVWINKYIEANKNESGVVNAFVLTIMDKLEKGQERQILKTLDSLKVPITDMLTTDVRIDCYFRLHMPDSVNAITQKLIQIANNTRARDYNYYDLLKTVTGAYLRQRRFSDAQPFVDSMLSAPSGVISSSNLSAIHMFKFRVDSAAGRYKDAINHLLVVKQMSDSTYNTDRIMQSRKLQLQYSTAEKDLENLELKNRNLAQKNELNREELQKKEFAAAFGAAVLIITFLTYLYYNKQSNNRQLQLRQNEINKQNSQLSELLVEKEWLVKEIHHRVKNNLQIISSLLNTQFSFLENEQAKAAIRESQNRMQAISKVHHRLYKSDDLRNVNMAEYVVELCESIKSSFEVDENLVFNYNVENIWLDTAQTVPLGLILNEAITNCIKYAFIEGKICEVDISFRKLTDNSFEFMIRDNGNGLPADFDADATNSLGVNLMKGLTEQLMGGFSITTDGGTVIRITFPTDTEA